MIRKCSDPVGDDYSSDYTDRLEKNIHTLLEEQEGFRLLQDLTKQGLCTRDVLSFTVKQAELRSINKELDSATSSGAMKSNIKECKQVLKMKKDVKKKAVLDFKKQLEGKDLM